MGMLDFLEERYPEGSDITIMNAKYQRVVKDEFGKKVADDSMIIVYKDNNTGKKNFIIQKKPDYIYYHIKNPDEVPDYNKLFIEREKVEQITVPFRKLERSIAELTGNEEFYETNLMNRDAKSNKKLHTDPSIFFSDTAIEDHYRFRFAMTYKNDIRRLTKGFFDIEVDALNCAGDFVQLGECPINAVTYMDEKSETVYTFILRDERNPLIQQFEDEVKTGKFGFKEIQQFVFDAVAGKYKKNSRAADPSNFNRMKKIKKNGIDHLNFQLFFYDYEIELIQDLFATIHSCSPDFVLTWNGSAFDIPYIIERIKVLNYDPAEIMCDKRFPIKIVDNYVDQKNLNYLAERGDYTFISGLPVFIDQEIQYASRRKAKIGSFKSFKLDDIGELEAKVKKLDYHHITDSVVKLPYLDFKTFILYNIMDVIVQKCIENKTQDMEYIFSKCITNNTSYNKGHRQTVYLINRFAADFYKKGYIIGNNCNRWNEKPPKFLGALVGKPINTNDYAKLKINGRSIWICDNLMDFDFKSLYPSIIGELNIAPNTQIGRIVIPDKVYKFENMYNIEEGKYSRSGEFIENMVTDNVIDFCSRWFNLEGVSDFLNTVDEYYQNVSLMKFDKYSEIDKMCHNKGWSPIRPITPNDVYHPICFSNKQVITPIQFTMSMPKVEAG